MAPQMLRHTCKLPVHLHAQCCDVGTLLMQDEWRNMGVQQSRGWVHYAIHAPEPHIMLFR
jgi:cyclin-dependent kinase regulatory subunit CKS1